jgi:DNA polymerase-4
MAVRSETLPPISTRQILHVDMDAFFAAIEQRDHPELRGLPVLVGGSPDGRGVVTAASYEARPYGPCSAMPMATALRLCPHAVVVPGRHGRYREVSRQIFRIFEQFSPVVEPLSIDEAFLDLTGTEALFGAAGDAAGCLKAQIRQETGLAASVGIAPNKFLAKLASDLCKPDGLLAISHQTAQALLDPLPVERLWGVGAATLRRFARMGVRTVGDVRRLSLARLEREFGTAAEHFFRLSRGLDDRLVCPDHRAKSISHEVTFAQDVGDLEHLRAVVLHQVEDVAYRLRRMDRYAGTVTLKIRYPNFRTITRAISLPAPTQLTEPLWRAAVAGFDAWAAQGGGPVRLIGVAAGNLRAGDGRQLSLFDDSDPRPQQLDAAVDALRERFGVNAVRRRKPGSA